MRVRVMRTDFTWQAFAVEWMAGNAMHQYLYLPTYNISAFGQTENSVCLCECLDNDNERAGRTMLVVLDSVYIL